jgi:hypothetical protein
MKLVSNKFLKYDLSNDTILEDVGRFIEFGGNLVDSESVVDEEDFAQRNAKKREEQKSTGLVDQLMNKVNMKKSTSRSELNGRSSRGKTPYQSILKSPTSKRRRPGAHARFG